MLLISSLFCDKQGLFKFEQSSGRPWKPQLVKFCKRVLLSLPRQRSLSIGNQVDVEIAQKQLIYVKETVQSYF